MSTYTQAMNALRARLDTFTGLPRFWPNDEQAPTPTTAPDGFVFSEGRLLDEGPVSIGPNGYRFHRDTGEFVVYVYVPRGTRVGTAEGYADQIRSLFQLTTVSDLIITSRVIGSGQIVDSDLGKYYAIPIVISFYTDRTE